MPNEGNKVWRSSRWTPAWRSSALLHGLGSGQFDLRGLSSVCWLGTTVSPAETTEPIEVLVSLICVLPSGLKTRPIATPELTMGWVKLGRVDPWLGLGWVQIFLVFCGLGWVHYSKSTINLK